MMTRILIALLLIGGACRAAEFSNIVVTPSGDNFIFTWDCSGCGDGNNITSVTVDYGATCITTGASGGGVDGSGDPSSFTVFVFGPIATPIKYILAVAWSDSGGGDLTSDCLTYPAASSVVDDGNTNAPFDLF